MITRKQIADRINDLGLTQIEVAQKSKLSQGTIYKLIHTTTIHNFDTVERIAKIIKVDPYELMLSLDGHKHRDPLHDELPRLSNKSKTYVAGFTDGFKAGYIAASRVRKRAR